MSSPTRSRKPKGQGHTRREEILDAAQSLILSEGADRATIRNIAGRLGVSATTLYLYFPDRDAIMLELCDRAFAVLVAQAAAILAEEAEPLAALRRLMRAYIRFGLDHPNEYRLIFTVKQAVPRPLDPHASPPAAGPGMLGLQAFAALRDLIARLAEQGRCVDGDPVHLAQMMWACGHGLVSLLITMPDFPWGDRETLIQAHVEMALRGLLRLPPPEGGAG